MTSIAEVAADLVAHPRPVLCLDTCDILNAMEGLSEKNAKSLEWTTRLLEALASRFDSVQPVVSYLVVHEWTQNLPKINDKVLKFLEDVDASLREIYLAYRFANQAPPSTVPSVPPSYSGTQLATHLVDRMKAVLNTSAILDSEEACVTSAMLRVLERRRPSHNGMIKDSLNLEHYLALVRLLRQSGFTERCLFVSANKADFWTEKKLDVIHFDHS